MSAEAAAAGQTVVTGLNPSVNYTLAVHFKSADRGKVSAWTRPSIEGATEVATSEALLQAITDKAAVIKVAYSETPYVLGSATIGGPIAIYGDATAQGAQPVIQGGLKIGADATKIHLEALTFDGLSSADYPHNLTFDAAATLESITVLNCTLNNYLRGILYENSKAPTVGKIHYNDVVVNNVGGDGGDCFDFRGAATVNEIVFENSTLNIGARTYFRIDANAKLESITMKNTTLNNLCFANNGNNNGIFNIRALNAAGAAPAFVLKKNVFLNMQDPNNRCCLIAKNSTSAFPTEIAENFFFNCYDRFFIPQKDGSTLKGDELAAAAAEGRAVILVNGSVELTADPCVDSGRDKLNVTNADVLKAGAGDPRWHAAYVEIPEDLTQAVTATGKIWNLTDGQTFKKLADKDMVRDGIRFYVKNTPVNFVKTGFEFSGAATVGEDGIPTDGAIGIKVNEPGSIVISVAESSAHSNLTVSLDGKIAAAVPAGAEYQKVTFANVSGEQMIYIYGCHPSTMTFLQWTSDVQVLDKVLATPVVKMNKKIVNERAEDNITLTWDAIDYAGSYNVTVDGKVKNVTETTYTFSTANFSVEEAGGDFAIQVTAVPASTDYTRVESAAAELSFHVNDVPEEPGLKVVRYDLAFPAAANAEETYACENNAGFFVKTTGGWVIDANSQKFAIPGDTELVQYASRLKGAKTTDSKTMTITVPNDGVLYIAARSANGTATDRTMTLIQNGTEILPATVIKDADKLEIGAFPYTVVNVKAGDIQVVLNNGINFYGIRYDATEGSAPAGIDGILSFEDYLGTASAGTLANEFEAGSIKLSVVVDADKKMAVDANTASFGTADAQTKYTARFKTGSTSGEKSGLKLTVAAKGTLKFAVRTGSNSSVRNLKLMNSGTELLACELDESKQKHTAGDVTYYDYFTVDVEAGEYDLAYTAGAVNIYAIEYVAAK